MRIQVGDFVRFTSDIVLKNSHLALTGDAGLVVGLLDDGTVKVVWNDGQAGRYPTNILRRSEGQIGKVVAATKRPIRDKGHKPFPTPVREMPKLLPQGRGSYEVRSDEEVKFIPTGKKKVLKNGQEREIIIPVEHRRIHVKCLRSGQTWSYNGIKRGGEFTYGDSRKETVMGTKKAPRYNEDSMRDELARLVGTEKAEEVMGRF